VLWMGAMNPPAGTQAWEAWTPQESYTAHAPCQAGAEQSNRTAEKRSGKYLFTFVCLPDTVDPRGPKGK